MNSVLARVRRTIADHALARPETRLVAAVSGGSDSMALLHILNELHRAGDLRLVGLVHFNHQLRSSADSDEQFVRAAADALALQVFAEAGQVATDAAREKRSLEDAARAARYACFDRARAHFAADVVALGHTRDDQAETFLLRLVRGAGPRGLAGMYPRNGAIVRPLVDCHRANLRSWLRERHVAFVEDETNADVSIPRNRVRAELIPLLASRFNPEIVDALASEADLAREAWQWIEQSANEIESRIVKPTTNGLEIDADAARSTTPALRRVVLWRAMNRVAHGRPVGFDHVAAAIRILDPDGPRVLDAPGQRLERNGSIVVLTNRPLGGRLKPSANLFWYPLSIPGEVELVEAGCIVSASAAEAEPDTRGSVQPSAVNGRGNLAIVRGDLCRGSLAVRNRRPGDRFQPPGLRGRKKLQDYFVDRKISRDARDRVPIVVDAADRIVWVAGYGIDEAFRVTDPGQAVLTLRLKPAQIQVGWPL